MKYLFFLLSISFFVFTQTSCTTTQSKPSKATTTVYFVRHAEKAKVGGSDPALTQEGERRAAKLATMLKGENVSAVYSTNYKRTRSTAKPLAELFDLQVEIYDHKTLNINDLIPNETGKTILVVGHSNSTPKLCNDLIGENKYQQFDESDYGNLLKVVIDKENKLAELIRF